MIARRFVRYCVVGGGNTLVHMAVAWLLVDAIGLSLLGSNVAAFLVANVVSFATNARITFNLAPRWRGYPRFLAVSLSALVVSSVLVMVAGHIGVHYLIAIAIAAVASAVLGFALASRLVFGPSRPSGYLGAPTPVEQRRVRRLVRSRLDERVPARLQQGAEQHGGEDTEASRIRAP